MRYAVRFYTKERSQIGEMLVETFEQGNLVAQAVVNVLSCDFEIAEVTYSLA